MATFANTTNPTPFGFFDSESQFQTEADNMVTFVKRSLGDDILSVELTKKQIWMCFERSFLEFGAVTNQYQAKSNLTQLLGQPTGSFGSSGYLSGSTHKYARTNLEMLRRQAEPYAMEAGIGGSYNMTSGTIELENGRQDYDIYTELKDQDGNTVIDSTAGRRGKMKVSEVFHFSPQAAFRYYGSTSGISYLSNEFSFESFTPETIFYVLPVFEDILRAGQMDISHRVRRSNYSYKITGTKIRIFPIPNLSGSQFGIQPRKLFLRVMAQLPDPFNPSYDDDTVYGVTGIENVPYGNLEYNKVNSIARQWVRNYALALSRELLGLVRSKFSNLPIPNAEITLNGESLVTAAREDQDKLRTELKELLESMTYDKLIEADVLKAENLQKQLRFVPMPNGSAITTY